MRNSNDAIVLSIPRRYLNYSSMSTLAKLEMKENSSVSIRKLPEYPTTEYTSIMQSIRTAVTCRSRARYPLSRLFLRARFEYTQSEVLTSTSIRGGACTPIAEYSLAFPTGAEICSGYRPCGRLTVRPLVSSTGGILAGCPPRAECRVYSRSGAPTTTVGGSTMVVADRAPARLRPAASGGPTLPGVRACRGIPRGGPYLSTDGVDGGPTETRHP